MKKLILKKKLFDKPKISFFIIIIFNYHVDNIESFTFSLFESFIVAFDTI